MDEELSTDVFWELKMDMYDSSTDTKSLGYYRTLDSVQTAEKEAIQEQIDIPAMAVGQIYFVEHHWED